MDTKIHQSLVEEQFSSNEKAIAIVDSSNNDNKECAPFYSNNQNVDGFTQFKISFLMAAPLIMGLCINALGHQKFIDEYYKIHKGYTKDDFSVLHSLGGFFPLGGLLAAPSSSVICDKFGKKKPTIFFFAMSIIGFIFKISAYYTPYWLIIIGRFFDGLASGGLMVTAISWLFDLAPKRTHVYYKPMIQIFINTGIVLIALFSLKRICGDKWHLPFLCQFVVSLIPMIVCLFLPESHVYQYSKTRDREQLEENLKKLRKHGYDVNEVNELVCNIENSLKLDKMSMGQFIRTRRFYSPLSAAILLNIFQQASGINVIVTFTIFLLTNNTNNNADIVKSYDYTLYILLSGLVGSIFASPFVGRFRRKVMLIIGFVGMSIAFIIAVVLEKTVDQPIAVVSMYTFFFVIFQVGPGPLVWFICIEIFPPEAVSSAQGVTTVANWLANTCVFFLFPIVNEQIKGSVLYIFIAINVISVFFIIFGMEETLNKEPNNIINNYNKTWKCFQ